MAIDRAKLTRIINLEVYSLVVDRKPASSVITKRCSAAREA